MQNENSCIRKIIIEKENLKNWINIFLNEISAHENSQYSTFESNFYVFRHRIYQHPMTYNKIGNTFYINRRILNFLQKKFKVREEKLHILFSKLLEEKFDIKAEISPFF